MMSKAFPSRRSSKTFSSNGIFCIIVYKKGNIRTCAHIVYHSWAIICPACNQSLSIYQMTSQRQHRTLYLFIVNYVEMMYVPLSSRLNLSLKCALYHHNTELCLYWVDYISFMTLMYIFILFSTCKSVCCLKYTF